MRRFGIALAALLIAGPAPARAEYPDRAIQIVVPYTPAGTVDLLARALAPRLTAAWGQPVVIINRPGAGGSVGAEFVAKSAPDGYTLFISTNSPLTTNLALYPSLGYEPLRDFEPVILAGENSLVLAANPQLPVKTVKDLIALAKTKPGELNAATSATARRAICRSRPSISRPACRSPMSHTAGACPAFRPRSPAKCSSFSAISCRSCRRFATTA
jgi:tripartite-type tricarboxylate transporter receptor subunit TctC